MKKVAFSFGRALFSDHEARRLWVEANTLRNNRDLVNLCKRLELSKAPILREDIDLSNLSADDLTASWALVGKALGYLEPEISGVPVPTAGRPTKKPKDMLDKKRADAVEKVATLASDKGFPPRTKRYWIKSGIKHYCGRKENLFRASLGTLENSVSRGMKLLEVDPELFTNKRKQFFVND